MITGTLDHVFHCGVVPHEHAMLRAEKTKQEPELTPQDKKGRRTAIITGFISIGFGVSLLGLYVHLTR